MVHGALRQVLGPIPSGRGSLNRPGYPPFRFQLAGPLSEQQRMDIEEIANGAVQADHGLHTFTTELDKARPWSAMALFGERTRQGSGWSKIGRPFSLELCGGTHVRGGFGTRSAP